MRFSSANAREMAAKSAEVRRNRHQAEAIATAIPPLTNGLSDTQATSLYANELMRAQVELLQELRETPEAKDKAALSQAIKNLREAWHMETGKPKPGTIKPVSARPRQSPAHESPDAPDAT